MKLTEKEMDLALKYGNIEVPMYQNYMLFYDEKLSAQDPNLYLKIQTMYYLLNEYGIGRGIFPDWNYANYNENIKTVYNDDLQYYIENMEKKLDLYSEEELEILREFGQLEEQPNKRIIIEVGKSIRNFAKYHNVDVVTITKDLSTILSVRNMMDHPKKDELYDVLLDNQLFAEQQHNYYKELLQFIRGGLHLSVHQKYELKSTSLDYTRNYMIDLNLNTKNDDNLSIYKIKGKN